MLHKIQMFTSNVLQQKHLNLMNRSFIQCSELILGMAIKGAVANMQSQCHSLGVHTQLHHQSGIHSTSKGRDCTFHRILIFIANTDKIWTLLHPFEHCDVNIVIRLVLDFAIIRSKAPPMKIRDKKLENITIKFPL